MPVLKVNSGRGARILAGNTTSELVSNGTLLALDDSVGVAGSGEVDLADGSRIVLGPGAGVSIHTASIDRAGHLVEAEIVQFGGRALYLLRATPASLFVVSTDYGNSAVVPSAGLPIFEVDLSSGVDENVSVFQGAVSSGRVSGPVEAGTQQRVGKGGQAAGQRQPLAEDPQDPLQQAIKSEATVAEATGGAPTGETFTSLQGLTDGKLATAGEYSTAGGDLTATLSYYGDSAALRLTGPDGQTVRREGPSPVTVNVPDARPGVYRLQVEAVAVSPYGAPYAVTIAAANTCSSRAEGAYVRTLTRSIPIGANLTLTRVGSGNTPVVLAQGASDVRFGHAELSAVLFAAAPRIQLNPLWLRVRGIPFPARALGTIAGSPIAPADPGFSVDRVYGCGPGFVIEGHR
ncbi:MAG TPA: hypothetical protein VF134_08015 [Candidatus Dormibacteraeota bacterium]